MSRLTFWLWVLALFITYLIGLWGILFSETMEENGLSLDSTQAGKKKRRFHETAKRAGVVSFALSLFILLFLLGHVPLWTFLKTFLVVLIIGYWMWRISRALS